MPTNSPELVDEILKALQFDGEEEVSGPEGDKMPIRLALLREYQIKAPHREFLNAMADHDAADQYLKELINSDVRTELDKFLWGRGIIDFLLESPKVKFGAEEFVSLLKKLQPRLYSIASSLKAHPEEVHLTVDTVRYEIHGRKRKGVCSNFLAERAGKETPVPVFIQVSRHFRVPEDADKPIIMVGPGTGIAPFRAFLEERKATGAKGGNWLFFGARKNALWPSLGWASFMATATRVSAWPRRRQLTNSLLGSTHLHIPTRILKSPMCWSLSAQILASRIRSCGSASVGTNIGRKSLSSIRARPKQPWRRPSITLSGRSPIWFCCMA